jgi:biotin carboxyl carrier protein
MVQVLVNGESFDVTIISRERNSISFEIEGRSYKVAFENEVPDSTKAKPSAPRFAQQAGTELLHPGLGTVRAPIPGVITEILVQESQKVEAGEVLLRIEAMKMQNNIFAPANGVVSQIIVNPGEEVSEGQELLSLMMGDCP